MEEVRADADYVLGTSRDEQARLRAQADAIGPISERLLVQAGIRSGMRVLDVGCGSGELSLLASQLVGGSGEVVGIDREPAMVEAARQRVSPGGSDAVRAHSPLSFVQGDFRETGATLGLFDAVVGRLVLMYQGDPVEAVRSIARAVRVGGVVVFQEYDSTLPPASLVPLPLQAKVRGWIWQTLERSGVDGHMGLRLYSVLEAAGLDAPEVRAEAIVQTPTTRYPVLPLVRALLPRMIEYGIATPEEVDLESLEARLLDERRTAGVAYVGQFVFGAWARRSASLG